MSVSTVVWHECHADEAPFTRSQLYSTLRLNHTIARTTSPFYGHRTLMSALSPTPIHLIRAHTSSVSSVSISDDNERIYSGDSAGIVVITSTRSLRSLASWNAHTDNILGVEEWGDQLITFVLSLCLFQHLDLVLISILLGT